MNVTVILCTHNRCASVEKTLEGIAVSKLADSIGWEVLVVDNNSTDGTRDVVDGFSHRFPGRFRYLFEAKEGKSYALNAGVREARGDVLAFVDDDVSVEPTWLQNLTAALDSGEWAGAGGRTVLAEAFLPPDWMEIEGPDSIEGALAPLLDLGPEPCALRWPPYGANMAFRKEMFEKYGYFRTDLGPSPNRDVPRPNEDTELGRRLMAAGERLRYEPSAVVYHPVIENRIRKSYFLGWYFDYGRAMAREWECGPDILGISRRCFAVFKYLVVYLPISFLRWAVTLNQKRRFFRKCQLWTTTGQIVELRRQWRNSKRRGNRVAEGTGGA